MLQISIILVSAFLFFYQSTNAQPQAQLKIEISESSILVDQTLNEWPTDSETTEFTINSSYEILEMNPAPGDQQAMNPEARKFRFPKSKSYHFRFRIPLRFQQSSQMSFYQEQSWYFSPVEMTKSIYKLQWVNKTSDTSLHLIHSAVPVLQEGIAALLGHFKKYETKSSSGVAIQIYLIDEDNTLADTLTSHLLKYLNHYEDMIGAYPYSNFAVAENVDPTGYAFPTMTWIGSQILRFPFILTTSLPHELLHSWWGNGVFVDVSYGNWCEGLTTYLADYFYQPSEAAKKDYRLKQLIEYENYVKAGAEVSLSEFRSRGEDRSLQAVGYGKSLFVFLMLEQQIGTENFKKTLQKFYSSYKGEEASFKNFFSVASEVSGQNMEDFFDKWILLKGAFNLSFEKHEKKSQQSATTIESILEPDFLQVEGQLISVLTKEKFQQAPNPLQVAINGNKITTSLKGEPEYIWFDPDFKLFRHLKPEEKPTVLSEILGQDRFSYLGLSNRPVDQQVHAEILKMNKSQMTAIEEKKIDFDKTQNLIIFGSHGDIFSTQAQVRSLIAKTLKDRRVYTKSDSEIEIQGAVYKMAGNAILLSFPVNKSKVLLVLTTDELNGTRVVQRMLRYGAQSFVLLGPTAAVTQGLWQGLESELKVRF